MQTNANFSAALTLFNTAVVQHAQQRGAWCLNSTTSDMCNHVASLVDVQYETVYLACAECALQYLEAQRADVQKSQYGICPALKRNTLPVSDTIGHLFRHYLLDGRNTTWSQWFEENRAAIATAYSGVAGDEHADAAWLDAIGRDRR